MIDDPVLVNDWHIVARSTEIADGEVKAASLLGEDLVLWRAAGQLMAWKDLCVHRGARLSLGAISGERIACPYHGWVYDVDGKLALAAPARNLGVFIVRIDPTSGKILGWIDLGGISPDDQPSPSSMHDPSDPKAENTLNGIAYDAVSGRLFVTGKNWPRLFEIRLRN